MKDVPEPVPLDPGPPDSVRTLENRLSFAFADRYTAQAALTHKSYVNEHRDEAGLTDNERLEFLGDAVIDLAVSHRLMERFPSAREGELSKMRAAVVDEQGLSEMGRAMDLGSLLRLGRGEELTGGRKKASLLADAMEAVVAAVYLDAGLGPVLGIIDRFFAEAFARASAGTLDRDYKTQFQELAQSKLRATPRYRVVAEHGPDHSKMFEVETDLRGEVVGKGSGRSKKDAEQAAAKLALEELSSRFVPNGEAASPQTPAKKEVEKRPFASSNTGMPASAEGLTTNAATSTDALAAESPRVLEAAPERAAPAKPRSRRVARKPGRTAKSRKREPPVRKKPPAKKKPVPKARRR